MSFVARYGIASLVFGLGGSALAQTNLAGTYADGQVFLRWDLPAGPVFTYDVYGSAAPETNVSNMTLLARVFPEEATGERMRQVRPDATLRVPDGPGYVTLSPTQGALAWTPHEAGARWFAVVAHGDTAVTPTNRTLVSYGYDPVHEPARPHLQIASTSVEGYPFAMYVVWVDGRDDPEDGRPDFPVMASASRGCVPHVFLVTAPQGGLPAGPYPAVFCLHGGGGEYSHFTPGDPLRANMSLELTNGIIVSPDDALYWQGGAVRQTSVTAWLGYQQTFDPFTTGVRTVPPDAVLVNYTSRRVFWIADWLTSGRGPFDVDPHHVAVIGHSAGSRGASHLSRQQPHRFSAAVLQCALFNFGETGPHYGSWENPTNLLSPDDGLPLTLRQVHTQSQRLAPDPWIPYTRVYSGKRDENDSGGWTPDARAGLDACNASQLGLVMNWDEREHGPEEWDEDAPDLLDDPSHCDPWPDAGQWIAPVKTERHSAQYLADRFRNDQSYPGFYDCDENPAAPGRQPDPGPGDPCSVAGVAWGSWGGCLDWVPATIVDTADRWECTVFLLGLSPNSVDNSLVPGIRASIAPRRTQAFLPAPGATIYWVLRVPPAGPIVQYGQTAADGLGVPKIEGLIIPREDLARARLVLSTSPLCPADFNGDGFVDFFDFGDYVACFESSTCPPEKNADFNGDNFVDFFDYDDFVAAFERGC